MPPRIVIDTSQLDLDNPEISIEEIRAVNPQRHEMEQLTAIVKFDEEQRIIVGLKDVRGDEFWVRGHIPGRPLMPGVLMCECAAQLCSYYFTRVTGTDKFIGFGGMDKVKFRGQVVPGDRLIMIARCIEMREPRLALFETQGVVDGKLVYEGVVTGLPM